MTCRLTGDPGPSVRIPHVGEIPAQRWFLSRLLGKANRAVEGGFRVAWARCGRALARERPDLAEQGEDVEVVADLACLVALEGDPHGAQDADAVSGRFEGAGGHLHRSGVGAFPEDLLCDGVVAGERPADGSV